MYSNSYMIINFLVKWNSISEKIWLFVVVITSKISSIRYFSVKATSFLQTCIGLNCSSFIEFSSSILKILPKHHSFLFLGKCSFYHFISDNFNQYLIISSIAYLDAMMSVNVSMSNRYALCLLCWTYINFSDICQIVHYFSINIDFIILISFTSRYVEISIPMLSSSNYSRIGFRVIKFKLKFYLN